MPKFDYKKYVVREKMTTPSPEQSEINLDCMMISLEPNKIYTSNHHLTVSK
jgi:hypothetical protein